MKKVIIESGQRLVVLSALFLLFPPEISAQGGRQVHVIVHAKPVSPKFRSDQPFMFEVSIYNGLKGEIGFPTHSLRPNGWGGEMTNLTFYDVAQKSGEGAKILWRRPEPAVPSTVSGTAHYRIKPKGRLTILVDAKKWHEGVWTAGKYEIFVRADYISVDRYTTMSVASGPIRFVVE